MTEYFIRNGRKLAGPFDESELQQMASIGRISRSTLVSTDQQNWFHAAQVDSVFPEYGITVRSAIEVPANELVALEVGHTSVPPVDRRFSLKWLVPMFIFGLAAALFAGDLISGRKLGLADFILPKNDKLPADANDDERIRKAVGLVICGRLEQDKTGERLEVPLSRGSCFLVSPDGFIITNKHVVEEIEPYTKNPSLFKNTIDDERYKELRMVDAILRVYLDGVGYPARILAMSDRYDMAILRINISNSPHFALAEEDSVPRNENVFAIGFPSGASTELTVKGEVEALVREEIATTISEFFDESDFTYTQTSGAVSRLESKSGAGDVIQHTANINKGNSGGPLIDQNGRVVGINTFGVIDLNTFYAVGLHQLRPEVDAIVSGAVWK